MHVLQRESETGIIRVWIDDTDSEVARMGVFLPGSLGVGRIRTDSIEAALQLPSPDPIIHCPRGI
jgi:hypothetical protein